MFLVCGHIAEKSSRCVAAPRKVLYEVCTNVLTKNRGLDEKGRGGGE